MSKDTFYFPHDYEPTSDPKIQALLGEFGAAGYGVFWRIIEMLHSDCQHKLPLKKYIYSALAKQMSTSVEQIETIINYCINVCELLQNKDDFIYSNRVNSNIDKRAQLIEKRSHAGKVSASVRQKLTHVNKIKESKGKKKNNINIAFSEFWSMYLRKEGSKKKCEIKWNNLTDEIRTRIINTLPVFFSHIKEQQFIPYPETYLNQERWNDEIPFKIDNKPQGLYKVPDISDIDAWQPIKRS